MKPDQLTPNKPRSLDKVHVGATPGTDARWRGLGKPGSINRVTVANFQREVRDPNPVRTLEGGE